MNLQIEGHLIQPKPGQSLLEMIKQLGLDREGLSDRPLAAKIAGEVFTLNYIPVREKDAATEVIAVRRAMAASGGQIRLLRYGDSLGKEAYIRTAQFAVFLAIRQLWPDAVAKISCTLGDSVYISVLGADDFSVSALKRKLTEIILEDIPLLRRRVSLESAIQRYDREGQTDKARLLRWRTVDHLDRKSVV